ncbi:MAG TPA: DivIVA domain-containing protein [Nocardia sp.]|uniref:DivIVA domain-containing protein n=1 Tax=Nocardia TaxID=1817 RepID=UPI00245498F7|nr:MULTISPECIES: DivIVA domain-containing protein [Nocardia]HLS75659.1 DivIVA domain-containing protein [Nocardia sp.]
MGAHVFWKNRTAGSTKSKARGTQTREPAVGSLRPGPRPGPTAPPILLTPGQVRQISFGPAPFGQRGYSPEEVDAFLDLVAATLEHSGAGSLTASDVHSVRFTQARWGVRGYHPEEVDAFLDQVIYALGGRRL